MCKDFTPSERVAIGGDPPRVCPRWVTVVNSRSQLRRSSAYDERCGGATWVSGQTMTFGREGCLAGDSRTGRGDGLGQLSISAASELAGSHPDTQRRVLATVKDENGWAVRGMRKSLNRAKRRMQLSSPRCV